MDRHNVFMFPGHSYLGPGNVSYGDPPVDSDDCIAQQHDLEYENAVDKSDIYKADEKTIFAFAVDCVKNKNWHSAIGAVGLAFKHLLEIICGKVFYPKLQ